MMFEAHRGGLQSPALARRATLSLGDRQLSERRTGLPNGRNEGAKRSFSRLNLYVCNLPKGPYLTSPVHGLLRGCSRSRL